METQGYFSRNDDESIAFMEELSREGIFFIEYKLTQQWILEFGYILTGMDDITTNDPHKAQKFKTKFEAMSYMHKEGLKLNDWDITEHEFVNLEDDGVKN